MNRRNVNRLVFGTLATAIVCAGATLATEARAQLGDCEKLTGKAVRTIAKTAQNDQSKCHKTANKISVGSDVCNNVQGLPFTIIDKGKLLKFENKNLEKVNAACTPGQLAQYPAATFSNIYPFIEEEVSEHGASALGGADLDGNEAKRDCFNEIDKGRKKLADKMLNAALKCQKDTGANGGPLLASCRDVALITTQPTKVGDKITAKCTGLTGADVGSCDPLPTCVTDSAVAEGQILATVAYPDDDCSPVTAVQGRTVTISIDTPAPLGGVQIDLDYPRFQSGIPDTGQNIDFGRFQNFTVAFLDPFDLDGRLRILAVDPITGISNGDLVDIKFDKCADLVSGLCDVSTTVGCNTNLDCRPPLCPTCGASEVCVPANRFCSQSQFQTCDGSPGSCPVGQTCAAQSNLTTCTVVEAFDTGAQPVGGVTCDVTVTEP